MLKFELALMPFHWYKVKNQSSGNIGNFNYRILPKGDKLETSCWFGVWCYERTKEHQDAEFEISEAGLADAVRWMEERFHEYPMEELEKPLSVLDFEPYDPAAQEAEKDKCPF